VNAKRWASGLLLVLLSWGYRSASANANTNPDDDGVVGPPDVIAECDARLKEAGVTFRSASLPVKTQPGGHACGAPQAIVYERGPGAIAWGSPIVTCGLALGMARYEAILQEEAQRTLGSKVKRIEHGGTYSCRTMARFRLVSEHSYANAIDVRAFVLESGKRVSVEGDFGSTAAPPATKASEFLRETSHRAFDENVFSNVLTPHFDALHRDHFHLDEARYRTDGSR